MSAVLVLFFLFDHTDSLGRAFLGTDATPFTVLVVDFNGNRALDYGVRAVKPADVT